MNHKLILLGSDAFGITCSLLEPSAVPSKAVSLHATHVMMPGWTSHLSNIKSDAGSLVLRPIHVCPLGRTGTYSFCLASMMHLTMF